MAGGNSGNRCTLREDHLVAQALFPRAQGHGEKGKLTYGRVFHAVGALGQERLRWSMKDQGESKPRAGPRIALVLDIDPGQGQDHRGVAQARLERLLQKRQKILTGQGVKQSRDSWSVVLLSARSARAVANRACRRQD